MQCRWSARYKWEWDHWDHWDYRIWGSRGHRLAHCEDVGRYVESFSTKGVNGCWLLEFSRGQWRQPWIGGAQWVFESDLHTTWLHCLRFSCLTHGSRHESTLWDTTSTGTISTSFLPGNWSCCVGHLSSEMMFFLLRWNQGTQSMPGDAVVDLLRQEDSLVEVDLRCFFVFSSVHFGNSLIFVSDFFAGRSSLSGLWRYPWAPFGCKGNNVFVDLLKQVGLGRTISEIAFGFQLYFLKDFSPTVKNGLDHSRKQGKPGRASGKRGQYDYII